MAAERSATAELGNTGYELFIGALSVLSLVNIVLVSVLRYDATQRVVMVMDGLLSLIFLTDFLVRLRRAPSRADYVLRQYGWADLLASLPFPQIKILRLFRLIRVARIMRRTGARKIVHSLLSDRAGSALLSLLLIGVLVLEFGSLAMLHQEHSIDGANIQTASDALWYVIVTMSTVGYGDTFPVGDAGRLLGAFIIVVGVGIFGTLTGYLANLFLAPRSDDAAAPAEAGGEAAALARRSRELMDEQQVVLARLEELLEGRRA